MRKRILSLVLTLTMVFTLITAVAASSFAITEGQEVDGKLTVYSGEVIDITFTAKDFYQEWYTLPRVDLYDSNLKYIKTSVYDKIVPENGELECESTFTSDDLKAGTYYAEVMCIPAYSDGTVVETEKVPESEYVQSSVFQITVKKLAAPKSVKAKAAKGKVTITFKKAAGADAYAVYRSTKNSGNFKHIGNTVKTKYVDKKVKKGKKYYYIVVSAKKGKDIETGKEAAIVSGNSKVAASGKVK